MLSCVKIAHRMRSLASVVCVATIAVCGLMIGDAFAKKLGGYSCYRTVCWAVPTMPKLKRALYKPFHAMASFYDDASVDPHNAPGLTSSGEAFDRNRLDRVASPNLPNGTQLVLWSPRNQRAVLVIVNNTGPFLKNRLLDLTPALAEHLGFKKYGLTKLGVVIVAAPTRKTMRYKKNRTYQFDGGAIGTFASVMEAAAAVAVGVPTPSGSRPEVASLPILSFGRKTRNGTPAKRKTPRAVAKHRATKTPKRTAKRLPTSATEKRMSLSPSKATAHPPGWRTTVDGPATRPSNKVSGWGRDTSQTR